MITHQLQVERRTGKVRQSEADVLPLCHATNCPMCRGDHILRAVAQVDRQVPAKTRVQPIGTVRPAGSADRPGAATDQLHRLRSAAVHRLPATGCRRKPARKNRQRVRNRSHCRSRYTLCINYTSDGLMPTEARGNYLPEPPYLRETKTYHWSLHDMLAIISSRYQYGSFLFFCCRSCQIT